MTIINSALIHITLNFTVLEGKMAKKMVEK